MLSYVQIPLYHEIKRRTGDMVVNFKALISEHPETEAGGNVEEIEEKRKPAAKKKSTKRKRDSSDDEEEAEEDNGEIDEDMFAARFDSGTEKKVRCKCFTVTKLSLWRSSKWTTSRISVEPRNSSSLARSKICWIESRTIVRLFLCS
jgi:hypothetical protein